MAMALHVNSWVLLGVVADGGPMDALKMGGKNHGPCVHNSFLGIQIHITAYKCLRPDYLLAALSRRAINRGRKELCKLARYCHDTSASKALCRTCGSDFAHELDIHHCHTTTQLEPKTDTSNPCDKATNVMQAHT